MQKRPAQDLKSILRRDDVEAIRGFLESTPEARPEDVLAQATESCAASVVRHLLMGGANPNHHLPTILILAIESRCDEVFDDLLEAGADLGSDPWWEDGDHPLTSAAATADPVAMKWLCDKGAVEIAESKWLEEALRILGSSRKKTARETLVILVQRLLDRLRDGNLKIETSALKKAADKLGRLSKRARESEAGNLAAALTELMDAEEAEEDAIIELTNASRFDELIAFVQAEGSATRSRRAGLALVWGIRKKVWLTVDDKSLLVPDPDGYPYLERLVNMDPDVYLTDDMGRTALMYAVWSGKKDLARKLVDIGADLEAVDLESGDSVLDWARLSANPDEMAEWVKQMMQERSEDRF